MLLLCGHFVCTVRRDGAGSQRACLVYRTINRDFLKIHLLVNIVKLGEETFQLRSIRNEGKQEQLHGGRHASQGKFAGDICFLCNSFITEG